MVEEGQVEVHDKVYPNRPYPTVIGCNQDHDADTCEVRVRHDSTVHNLTCVMEQVKPAVELRWLRARPHGHTVLDAFKTVRPVIVPAYMGLTLRNNTFSTSASIQVSSVDDDAEYVCEAMGVAVGGNTRTRVRLTRTHNTTATYDRTATQENAGTTGAMNDEVMRTDYSIGTQTIVYMIVPVVMSSISLLCSIGIMLYLHIVYRRQKKCVNVKGYV